MTHSEANLDNFIEKASDLLAENEANFLALAKQVTQYQDAADNAESNGQAPSAAHLQYIEQQTHYLSDQSQSLKDFLNARCQTLPVNRPLSRIQILQQQEEARSRTAKALEESAGQLLANAIFELAAIKQFVSTGGNPDDLISGINALQDELEQGLANLRFLIADLEPSSTLGSFGLFAGLRRYLEKYGQQTGIKTHYETRIVVDDLPNTVELAIFRIVQEALQNIREHAQATEVQVIVSEASNELQFSVIDNGIGFKYPVDDHGQRHLGLVGMKDLTDLLKGKLQIQNNQEGGTCVMLTIPYPKL